MQDKQEEGDRKRERAEAHPAYPDAPAEQGNDSERPCLESPALITAAQLHHLLLACAGRWVILIGYAGSGKSTAARHLIDSWTGPRVVTPPKKNQLPMVQLGSNIYLPGSFSVHKPWQEMNMCSGYE